MAPWADMKKAYLSGGKTLRQLANEWQVPFSDVFQRSRQEGWSAQRRREETPERKEKEAARRRKRHLLTVADRAVGRIGTLLQREELSVDDVKKLTGALEDIRRTQMIRVALDEEEQLARIEAYRLKNQPQSEEAPGGVVILAKEEDGEE